MILLCPPEKSTQFHYPLDPKKIRSEGSMHKDTTYQGSDRQDFYRHGKKQKNDEINADLDWFAIGNPVKIRPDVVPLLSAREMKQLGVSNSSDMMSLRM